MRKILVPRLQFGVWTPWEDRATIKNAQYPGVYMMCVSRKRLNGRVSKIGDCHYIGMTISKRGLRGRWGQFNSAVNGKGGHSGGNAAYSHLGHYANWQKPLYVSSMPVMCNVTDPTPENLKLMGAVAYLEFEAFAEFRRLRPRLKKPKYNTK